MDQELVAELEALEARAPWLRSLCQRTRELVLTGFANSLWVRSSVDYISKVLPAEGGRLCAAYARYVEAQLRTGQEASDPEEPRTVAMQFQWVRMTFGTAVVPYPGPINSFQDPWPKPLPDLPGRKPARAGFDG